MDNIVCGRCSVIQMTIVYVYLKNVYLKKIMNIFRHLELEIALAIFSFK